MILLISDQLVTDEWGLTLNTAGSIFSELLVANCLIILAFLLF